MSTIKKTIQSIIAHHIVGVQVFCLCSLKNSVAFHIVAFSLICFQSFSFVRRFIYDGVNKKPTKNVEIQKEKISIKFECIILY
jgi:hypothetical protein